MQCKACGSYYRRNEWNTSDYCEKCVDSDDSLDYNTLDEEQEIELLLNPSGKVQPKFYD